MRRWPLRIPEALAAGAVCAIWDGTVAPRGDSGKVALNPAQRRVRLWVWDSVRLTKLTNYRSAAALRKQAPPPGPTIFT